MPAAETERPAIAAALALAEAACARRGARLTPLRRRVLSLILESQVPVGAYALLDRLREDRAGAAPPTVYRALDFLTEQRLVHRIERLNAFIACRAGSADCGGPSTHGGDHLAHDHPHGHAAQFLICGRCGTVAELEDDAVSAALSAAARQAGFVPSHATVEVEGLCRGCAAEGQR